MTEAYLCTSMHVQVTLNVLEFTKENLLQAQSLLINFMFIKINNKILFDIISMYNLSLKIKYHQIH